MGLILTYFNLIVNVFHCRAIHVYDLLKLMTYKSLIVILVKMIDLQTKHCLVRV